MVLRQQSSEDTDTQEIRNGSSNSASHTAHFPPTQATLSSQSTVQSEPVNPVASDSNSILRPTIAYDDVFNPWTQELAHRPATREGLPSSRADDALNQPLQGQGQSEGGVQTTNSYDGRFEGGEPPLGSSVGSGRSSASPGQFRSNNPFLRARQNSTGPPKYSVPGPDPFDFPPANSLNSAQDGKSPDERPNLHGPHGDSSQLVSQASYENALQSDSVETGSANPFLDKGKQPVFTQTQTTETPPLNLSHQPEPPDYMTHVTKPEDRNLTMQPTPPNPLSPSPNLIDLDEDTKPNDIAQPDGKRHQKEPARNLLGDAPENKPGISVSNPDEANPSVSISTVPAEASDRFQQSLSQPNGSAQSRSIQQEKLNETYDIRKVNWTDGSTELRKSPVLVQNENGPCPLLALVNGLVMRSRADSPSPITKALQSREKISLGLLMQALFDELTSYIDGSDQLPDIEALSSFLVMLDTGMNVNPKLVLDNYPCDSPGTFLETNDTRLYSSFKLPLVHGWLANPSTAAHAALSRVAQDHEDIQLLHFRKEEIEDRVFRGESLTDDEEKLMQDIDTIQYFVNVENATQLSAFGLEHLEKCLEPGSVSILFRNDHFSTLFKHPQSHQLFTLVTDAGYANHAEIVWESLVDVNGSNTGFFSGDFRPVGNFAPPPASSQRNRQRSATTSGDGRAGNSTDHTEQTDADYAFALALQFQDEEEQRRSNTGNQNQTQQSHLPTNHRGSSSQSLGTTHARSNSSSNIGHRQSTSSFNGRRVPRQTQDVRSLVPPRGAAVGGDNADAPPPTYEQAAKSPVYIPSPNQSSYDGSNPSIAGPRSSSYGYNNNPGPDRGPIYNNNRRGHAASNPSLPPRPRGRDKSKDCIVM
ncbi:hypothetical protein AJ79_06739 [Helicocarpus griseus UAMH5409]|uniref:MINDY deubiquitinase domain-containing protein n=1 Tax=Helicocarpus griseus UAMH5409 TaxID=1447875 RepID=A0A2B7XAG6_9EURO|nr:hypothetical protein AJ79_06739 [Helicocarpus griseus UAMH5409]